MPLDRGIIDQQLQALGEGTRWWNQRELRDLPTVLNNDEEILAIARGKIARLRWLRRAWLVVVTDQRVVLLRSGGRSWQQFDVRGDHITRVSLRVGPFRGRVLFATAAQTYRVLVPRPDAYKLAGALSTFASAHAALPSFAPTRVIRRVVDHVFALPAAALDPGTQKTALPPAARDPGVQQRLDALEEEVNRLRQQVDFLEQLLHERPAAL